MGRRGRFGVVGGGLEEQTARAAAPAPLLPDTGTGEPFNPPRTRKWGEVAPAAAAEWEDSVPGQAGPGSGIIAESIRILSSSSCSAAVLVPGPREVTVALGGPSRTEDFLSYKDGDSLVCRTCCHREAGYSVSRRQPSPRGLGKSRRCFSGSGPGSGGGGTAPRPAQQLSSPPNQCSPRFFSVVGPAAHSSLSQGAGGSSQTVFPCLQPCLLPVPTPHSPRPAAPPPSVVPCSHPNHEGFPAAEPAVSAHLFRSVRPLDDDLCHLPSSSSSREPAP